MSKQKEMVIEQNITNLDLLKRAAQCVNPGVVIDTTSKQNRNRWHTIPTEINIGADHLYQDEAGNKIPLTRNEGAYGSVGFAFKDGKLVPQVCSQEDSHYIDESVRRHAADKKLKVNQPDGKFAADMEKYVKEIMNAYVVLELSEKMKRKAPSARITAPQAKTVSGRKNAWAAKVTLSEEEVNKLVASGAVVQGW